MQDASTSTNATIFIYRTKLKIFFIYPGTENEQGKNHLQDIIRNNRTINKGLLDN